MPGPSFWCFCPRGKNTILRGKHMAYELEEAKKLVVAAGKKLVESGLIARTWGNVIRPYF